MTINSPSPGSTLGQPQTAFQAWTSQGKQVSPSKMVDSVPSPLRWLRVKESACQCRRCGFDPWMGKTPWIRKWPSTPVFLPGKSHGQRGLASCSPWSHRVGHNLTTKPQSESEHVFICLSFIWWITCLHSFFYFLMWVIYLFINQLKFLYSWY